MSDRARSAVVMGGSMSGLLAAKALSRHFSDVAIVERDLLPSDATLRKGVPQAAHAHGLLAGGYHVIDAYFPGIMDELEQLGASRGDVVRDFLWFQYGRWKLRHDAGLSGIVVSRPCLEAAIRKRVLALPNVRVHDGTAVVKPVFDATAGRVTGVLVRHDGDRETQLDADLVVDATGRGSQSTKWLEEWGFPPVPVTTVTVNVGYATRVFKRRPGEFFNSTGAIVSGTPPADKRYAAVLAAEGNRWVITLAGTLGDYPPADEAGWIAFAASLPIPVIHELVTSATPISDIVTYRFPANQRRMYEKVKRFPSGYLVVGDAVCSFNPIYGQGMSAAAMEASALDDELSAGLEGLARRFYARASTIIDMPWTIATGEDLRFPEVEGPRPPGFALVNKYLERVHAVASSDRIVCQAFFNVLNLLAPPTSLMAPGIMWRVLTQRVPSGIGTPWGLESPPPQP